MLRELHELYDLYAKKAKILGVGTGFIGKGLHRHQRRGARPHGPADLHAGTSWGDTGRAEKPAETVPIFASDGGATESHDVSDCELDDAKASGLAAGLAKLKGNLRNVNFWRKIALHSGGWKELLIALAGGTTKASTFPTASSGRQGPGPRCRPRQAEGQSEERRFPWSRVESWPDRLCS